MYKNNASVSLLTPDGFVDEGHTEEIPVEFDIDMDVRDWGIKEMLILPTGHATIQFSGFYMGSDEEHLLQASFDLSKLKKESIKGRGITVTGVEIWLDPNMQVDYEKSTITISTSCDNE